MNIRGLFVTVGLMLCCSTAMAQTASEIARIRAAAPYEQLRAKVPGLTRADYDRAVRQLAASRATSTRSYLGRYSTNPYDPQSTSNPYGSYGSRYSPQSINNPYGTYGSPYSSKSVTNPYTSGGPRLYGQDGTYLGRMNSNRYDPESISNPYGRYGSPYSPNSINNRFGRYGSPYSPYSPNNPYSTEAPVIIDDDN